MPAAARSAHQLTPKPSDLQIEPRPQLPSSGIRNGQRAAVQIPASFQRDGVLYINSTAAHIAAVIEAAASAA